MADPLDPPGAFEIPSRSGIRALSCLLVFFGHAVPPRFARLVPPAFGVTVFFVLSGYLITTLMRREFERSGSVRLRDFYTRRVLRIWPSFYIVLALTTLLTVSKVLEGQVSTAAVLAYAGHIGNYWRIDHGLYDSPSVASVYWSLGVEEHFYLLFPLGYLMLQRLKISTSKQLIVLLVLANFTGNWGFHLTVRYLLQALLLWAIFTVAARYPDFGPMRLLNTAPLRLLGALSYTFYLSHRAILSLFDERTHLEWPVKTALALASTILFSYLMYVAVEVPCARLRRRFTHANGGQALAEPVLVPVLVPVFVVSAGGPARELG